jgi:hypothetical protein
VPDLIRRLWIKLGFGLVALVVAVVGLGALDPIKAVKDWLGFIGSVILVIPVLHLELAKLEIKNLRSLQVRDHRVRAHTEEELKMWEADLGRHRAWHGWCLCLGLASIALAFRAGLRFQH